MGQLYIQEMIFLSLTNKNIDNPKNVISAGINASSQIKTIMKFKEMNNINKTIFLIPNSNFQEEVEDAIIGRWTTGSSSFEEYENMNCTGSLEESLFFGMFNYSETYEIRDGGFTWSQTSAWQTPYTEEGTYETTTTDTSTVYSLLGTTTNHGIEGYREGLIGLDENAMSIKVQWDKSNNQIVDSCFKFTYAKI